MQQANKCERGKSWEKVRRMGDRTCSMQSRNTTYVKAVHDGPSYPHVQGRASQASLIQGSEASCQRLPSASAYGRPRLHNAPSCLAVTASLTFHAALKETGQSSNGDSTEVIFTKSPCSVPCAVDRQILRRNDLPRSRSSSPMPHGATKLRRVTRAGAAGKPRGSGREDSEAVNVNRAVEMAHDAGQGFRVSYYE